MTWIHHPSQLFTIHSVRIGSIHLCPDFAMIELAPASPASFHALSLSFPSCQCRHYPFSIFREEKMRSGEEQNERANYVKLLERGQNTTENETNFPDFLRSKTGTPEQQPPNTTKTQTHLSLSRYLAIATRLSTPSPWQP